MVHTFRIINASVEFLAKLQRMFIDSGCIVSIQGFDLRISEPKEYILLIKSHCEAPDYEQHCEAFDKAEAAIKMCPVGWDPQSVLQNIEEVKER